MFDKEYTFKGTHADKVIRLTAKFDDKNSIFKRNIDVYMMAPIIGFLYQRKSESNMDGEHRTTKIFPEQLLNCQNELAFNYRLIMLLDKNNEKDIKKRIDKAFREYNSKNAVEDEKLFDSYVLGGVDVLYEKIIDNASSMDGYLANIYDFMEELNDRYNKTVDNDRVIELCRLAQE